MCHLGQLCPGLCQASHPRAWRKPGFCGRVPACASRPPALQDWELREGHRVTLLLSALAPTGHPAWPPGFSAQRCLEGGGGLLGLTPTPVPAERLCPGDQLYSDCAWACPPSCPTVGEGGEGSCRECLSGCECPPGLSWDGALCGPASQCPCYYRRQRYAPGDTVRQLCNPCWVRRCCWPFRWAWRPPDLLGSLPYAISSTWFSIWGPFTSGLRPLMA